MSKYLRKVAISTSIIAISSMAATPALALEYSSSRYVDVNYEALYNLDPQIYVVPVNPMNYSYQADPAYQAYYPEAPKAAKKAKTASAPVKKEQKTQQAEAKRYRPSKNFEAAASKNLGNENWPIAKEVVAPVPAKPAKIAEAPKTQEKESVVSRAGAAGTSVKLPEIAPQIAEVNNLDISLYPQTASLANVNIPVPVFSNKIEEVTPRYKDSKINLSSNFSTKTYSPKSSGNQSYVATIDVSSDADIIKSNLDRKETNKITNISQNENKRLMLVVYVDAEKSKMENLRESIKIKTAFEDMGVSADKIDIKTVADIAGDNQDKSGKIEIFVKNFNG